MHGLTVSHSVLHLRRATAGLLTCGLLLLAGCGEAKIKCYPVRGTVKFANGAKVRTGVVEFHTDDNQVSSTGKIQKDGTFVLGTYTSDDGAPEGNHKVIVLQMIINDGFIKHSEDHGAPVDPAYASLQSTPLTAKVEAKENNEVELIVQPASRR